MQLTMFLKFSLELNQNLFNELANSTIFENITTGRKGAVLVNTQDNLIPLVRTTTVYSNPPQQFMPIHYNIINQIKEASGNPELEFNNALIEIYNSSYKTMGYHSDQALDLKDDSYICVFSCYDELPTQDTRKLLIQDKTTKKTSEIILDHNSCVLFSLSTNAEYLHKIILEKNTDNRWLGITFRMSKTLINFVNETPYFYPSNKILRIVNEEERKQFFEHRSNENKQIGYIYPELDYTISKSDMLLIN